MVSCGHRCIAAAVTCVLFDVAGALTLTAPSSEPLAHGPLHLKKPGYPTEQKEDLKHDYPTTDATRMSIAFSAIAMAKQHKIQPHRSTSYSHKPQMKPATRVNFLREAPSNTVGLGSSASLCAAGYRSVRDLKNVGEMENFIDRVIAKYHGTVLDAGSLAGIFPFYSGVAGSEPSYSDLIYELDTATWLDGFMDAAKVSLDEDGYAAIADMEDDDQMRAFIRRVILAHGGIPVREQLPGRILLYNEPDFFSIATNYSGTTARHSYRELVEQLQTVEWLHSFQPTPVANSDDDVDNLKRASSWCKECRMEQLEHEFRPPLLYIGVFSAPSNWARRAEARKSWMQDAVFRGPHPMVTAKFIIGKADKDWLNFDLQEENRVHGDIEFMPTEESYANLPNKSITFFRWFAQKYCCLQALPKYWYVMKLDDDSYPNLPIMLPHLNARKEYPSSLNYVGGFLWNGPVLSEGKWAENVNVSLNKINQYPAYAAGSGYILSMDLARKMDELVEERGITLLRNEDTTIGNWIHQENHLTMSVNYHNVQFREYGCEDGVYTAMNLCPGELRCMWEKRLNGTTQGGNHSVDMCCNPPEDYGLPKEGCLPAHQ